MAITFPSSPTNGQKFDSGTTRYTYSTATGAWSAAPLGTALPFNLIVNSSMLISQENGTTAGSTSGYYPADQWVMHVAGAPIAVGTARASRTSPDGSPNCVYFDANNAPN